MRYIDISFKNLFGSVPRGGLLYIFGFSVSNGLVRPSSSSPVSILFFPSRHPPFWFVIPFVSVGSAKVGIFFELPNKIIFIFRSFFLIPSFQYADVIQLSALPNRAAKVAIFFSYAIFILK